MNRKKFKMKQLSIENLTLRQDLAVLRQNHESLEAAHGPHFRVCQGHEHCAERVVTYERNFVRLGDQTRHSSLLEKELKTLKEKYKMQITGVKLTAQFLENELAKVRKELSEIITKAESADKLRAEVRKLRAKVNRRDSVIDRYESKYGYVLKLMKTMHKKGLFKTPPSGTLPLAWHDASTQTSVSSNDKNTREQEKVEYNSKRDAISTSISRRESSSDVAETPMLSCLAIALKEKLEVDAKNARVI